MKNLDRLDRIYIKNGDDLEKLLDWRDSNKDLVRNYKHILTEGVIQFEDIFEEHFKCIDLANNIIAITTYWDRIPFLSFTLRVNTGDVKITYVNQLFVDKVYPDYSIPDLLQDAITIHASLMALMEHYQGAVETSRAISYKPPKKSNKHRPNKKRIKIMHKVFRIIPSKIPASSRSYNRHTESWKVRGHWRHYKSGKKVWVREHIKGNPDVPPSPRKYEL